MLTMKRCEGEKIIILVPPSSTATKIVVQLGRVTGHTSARIGTTAPRFVQVDREEIFNRKKWDAETFGVESPSAHDIAELDDVPAIIAEAKAFALSAAEDASFVRDIASEESVNNMMIGRLATLLSQERRRK